jgi:hypothetical protein
VIRSLGLLAAVLAAACSPAIAPEEPERRRPDGVTLDLPPALPEPSDAAASGDGVVVLRTPVGSDAALDVLRAYVRAIVAEDAAAMTALHTDDATFVLAPAGQVARSFPSAAGLWERRFARLDYSALAGAVVVRDAEAQVRRLEAGEGPPAAASVDEDDPVPVVRDAEVVVRAPVATARIAGQTLLGSEIILYLRRDGARYRVSSVVEDFSPP